MKRIKKILKISSLVLGLCIVVLLIVPIVFEDKIIDLIKENINKNVNATLDFEDADLSLIRQFPKATVSIQNLTLTNFKPFEGDTLFAAKNIVLTMSVKELFRSKPKPIQIDDISLDGVAVNLYTDEEGNVNYDIAKKDNTNAVEDNGKSEDASIDLALNAYKITNTSILYHDKPGGLTLEVKDLNHSGSGDFSLGQFTLETHTDALFTFTYDSIQYLNRNPIKLDALIGINLAENKYSFLENEALINQLPLIFDGYIKLNETNQELDINFKTPSSAFKNFLAVLPQEYAKDIQNVKTDGNFEINGRFYGSVDETHIPKFDIAIMSENAMFKYPELPKSVENIYLNTTINNATGITNDTKINIEKLSFKIDQDVFNANASIYNLTENPVVNAHVDGDLNLGNLSKAYPVDEKTALKGRLKADVTTYFDLKSIEEKRYEKTENSGNIALSDFEYRTTDFKHPIQINKSQIRFNPTTVDLETFEAKTGQTDLNASGVIKNLLGFLFNDEKIEGDFRLTSNVFAIDDFKVNDANSDTEVSDTDQQVEAIKIPAFLDASVSVNAVNVYYDNLNLNNVKGMLLIKDEKALLSDMSAGIFDGELTLNGSVSTKEEQPVFDMKMGMNALDISQSFTGLDLLKVLAPVASALEGKFNSTILIKGNLDENFTPDLSTISGNALANLLASSIKPGQSEALKLLDNKLNFIDLKNLDFKELQTSITFDKGKVQLKPTQFQYKDIAVNLEGNHAFDASLDYKATFQIPARYLGKEVTDLLVKLDNTEDITVPVEALISGNLKKPSVTTDLKSALTKLSKDLADRQKKALLDKGKGKLEGLVKDLVKKKGDSTDNAKEGVKEQAGKLLNNLFRKRNKKKDSTKN